MERSQLYNPMHPLVTFVFFPYLKTSQAVQYRGLTFGCTTDSSGLNPEVLEHLEVLRRRFFLRDNLRIAKFIFTYAILPAVGPATEEFLQKVREFRALATYTYGLDGEDEEPLLSNEHGTAFVVRPRTLSRYVIEQDINIEATDCPFIDIPANEKYVDGYEGILNHRNHFWFTEHSQVYPPAAYLWLNAEQDLSVDILRDEEGNSQSVFHHFSTRQRLSGLDERVLTSIEWYNRSLSREADDQVLLMNLAVAFESLLGLEPGEKVTARFKDAVALLIGPVPRLDSWLSQFYDARSKIIHEGRTERLMFIAVDDPKKSSKTELPQYRPLITYGRTVFRICLMTVLTGSRLAEKLQVASLFRTNAERLSEICRILREGVKNPREALLAAEEQIRATDQYRFVSDSSLTMEQLLGTLKTVVESYRATNPPEDAETLATLDQMRGTKVSEYLTMLRLLVQLRSALREPFEGDASEEHTRRLLRMLTDTVWHYTFLQYTYLERIENRSSGERQGKDP